MFRIECLPEENFASLGQFYYFPNKDRLRKCGFLPLAAPKVFLSDRRDALGESVQFLFTARLRISGPWIILLKQRNMPIWRLSKLSKNSSEICRRVLKNGRGSIKLF